MIPRARIIAYYLPQYHVIPENETWWGEHFTDWVNVRKAQPLFPGHYQPRVPAGENYYSLDDTDTHKWQIDLARDHGVEAFCHYHYWFNGRQLLQRPTDMVIANRDLDFPFCLAWINTTWSRRWSGSSGRNSVLVKQTYATDRQGWLEHFEYLWKAWSDPRHVVVNGKPVFQIYSPNTIPKLGEMLSVWRDEAARRGLPGLHVVAMQLHAFLSTKFLRHFDAVALLQPGAAMFLPDEGTRNVLGSYARSLPAPLTDVLRTLKRRLPGKLAFHEYDDLWKKALVPHKSELPVYPGAFVDWDNTPRYGARGRIARGASPERFQFWMSKLVDGISDRAPQERLIFLNAWNEWAEGAYLEPDERYGSGYLQALRSSVNLQPPAVV